MKPRMIILLGGLFFCSTAMAQEDFQEYEVSIGWGGTVPVMLPHKQVESYRDAIKSFSESIMSCRESELSAQNPLLNESQRLSVSNSAAGCSISLESYSTWFWECQLPKSAHQKLGQAMKQRSLDDELLGDYSEIEKDILFDQRYCRSKKMR